MSKKSIYLIIGLIVTAIVGLIILQLRLLQTGLEVNKERYDRAIQSALKKVADEVEDNEEDEIRLTLNNGYAGGVPDGLYGELRIGPHSPGLLGATSIRISPNSFRLRAQFANRNLEERIDREAIHQKLTKELRNAGIEDPLEYGIYDTRQQRFLSRNGRLLSPAGSDTSRHQDLMNGEYVVSLFDDDATVPGEIRAYSPDKDSVIYSSLYENFAASLLFVLIILGCFIYTIYVILMQKKVSEMKTDFINNMTHEFKTPIATISLATDSIVSPRISGDPAKVQRFARIIKQENKRMNDQVEKVLQMAKLDKSRLNLNLTAVDLNEVVQSAVEYICLQVEPRGGTVTMKLNADPSVVEGDLTHLSSLINNLLDNANKYSPEAPRITVTTANVARGVQVTVADQGLGMTREARKNIFDRFYRVHTGDRHDVKGFGLGLSYVKTITEVHGGSIEVKSELGKGSSFIVTFPYRQPD
ncbi:two-component system phosphate regulon sensor histidine kinase PhoR [Lewinella marina]|uniref:histidine kinase n=1 Tax=Neolewinella marina TaxID=438751 RepID=A0A2G0CB96_9BACT|nr:HAMP domain-containing sensor histidine kinase [Neolewinella marina]NJB87789.1 two-component system phosphate regulon sensor histidine kinase PhoR [Neolewinella marina]PHK97259.1 histidine kinase [Neolewinella marina]